ncbi:MAG: hypothetical protein AAF512_15710 [Pseudomonadota bacterium]
MKQEKNQRTLRRTKLEKAQFEALRDCFETITKLPKLKEFYNTTPYSSSLPHTIFCIRSGEAYADATYTQIYGLIAKGIPSLSDEERQVLRSKPDIPPKELPDLHKFLLNFDVADALEWQPKYIEVII